MAFFKRIEVWLLLGLSLAGVAWVLWSEAAAKREDSITAPEPAADASDAPPPAYAIRERRVSREGESFVLTLRLGRATEGGQPADLGNGAARLVTASGETVPPFFLPFDPPPVLAAGAEAAVDLRYWLPAGTARGGLWLEFAGERLPVREPGAADLKPEDFPSGVEVAVAGPLWERR